MALPVERYKYTVLLPLLYFPFFSSLRNVLSTPLYLGFSNLVHSYHCPWSLVITILSPRRTLIPSQLHRCRRTIIAPLGLPKYRRKFVTLSCINPDQLVHTLWLTQWIQAPYPPTSTSVSYITATTFQHLYRIGNLDIPNYWPLSNYLTMREPRSLKKRHGLKRPLSPL